MHPSFLIYNYFSSYVLWKMESNLFAKSIDSGQPAQCSVLKLFLFPFWKMFGLSEYRSTSGTSRLLDAVDFMDSQ